MDDVLKRLESLESKVAKLKDWKRMYETEKSEKERLLKSKGTFEKFRNTLLQFLGLDSIPSYVADNSGGGILNLEHKKLVVNLSHSEKEINMTTSSAAGRVMLCAIKELPQEGFTESEVSETLKEHGWNVVHNTLAPTLGGLVRDGNLVRLGTRPTKYRLPQKVKLNVVDKPGNTD